AAPRLGVLYRLGDAGDEPGRLDLRVCSRLRVRQDRAALFNRGRLQATGEVPDAAAGGDQPLAPGRTEHHGRHAQRLAVLRHLVLLSWVDHGVRARSYPG